MHIQHIEVFACYFPKEGIPRDLFDTLVQQLSLNDQIKVGKFKSYAQASCTLAGRLLLMTACRSLGRSLSCLDNMEFGRFGKPSLANNEFHFNISHTNGAAVCATSVDGSIGIDIERVRKLRPQEFKRFFTRPELDFIGDDIHRFITLWSRKEALMKADGRGISMDPTSVEVLSDHDTTECGDTWYLHPLTCHDGYQCHVASSDPTPKIGSSTLDLQSLHSG